MKKKILVITMIGLLLASGLVLVACGTPGGGRMSLTPGTYTATAASYSGPLTVEVRTSANAITGVRVTRHVDTPGIADWAIEAIPQRIIEHQSLAVDTVSGVTVTSMAIISAVDDALRQAGADMAALYRPIRRPRVRNQTLTADVIVVGSGGAGLSAAAAAIEAGASVILIEKEGFLGGNSLVGGGALNVANTPQQLSFPSSAGLESLVIEAINATSISNEHRIMQDRVRSEFEAHRRAGRTHVFDSPAWHALQTWEGGDRLGFLPLIYVMTSNALAAFNWMANMGLQYDATVQAVAGALYPRTIQTTMPLGVGIINAFSDTLARSDRYTLLMETTATGLIMDGERVVGVNAEGRHGNRVTLRANRGVVLATGGFGANVEMRQRHGEGPGKWDYLGPTLNTSNVAGATGEGIYFARDAGAELIHMDQIQILHVANPWTGVISCISLAMGAAETGLFINQEGNRFVREDGRRDDLSRAILAQTGGVIHLITSSEGIPDPTRSFTADRRTVAYMVENNVVGFVMADTLEELARAIGADANNLIEAVREYNSHVDSQLPDRFGRAIFSTRLETGPWFAQPRAPTVHYTMGGVRIDEHARAIRPDGSPVPGLYAAGEMTGGIHGTNRLGGNAYTDIHVFGRIAGANAAARR